MTKSEFLIAFQDVLQRDDPVAEMDKLAEFEEWDSLSKMATMAFFKKHFDIVITLDALGKFETVADLIELAGGKIK